ncbi:nuclease-related domain-containing protein [Oryzobacter sp. R7]|uniref:nuclease-related domain-containing protein n=1 Tax=Oryzobacter faecalis TaxID=3388656 RepID=UPI00398CE083
MDDAPAPPTLDVGTAGAGARREYERRRAKDDAARAERSRVWRALNAFFYPDGRQSTHAWRVGAAGEERVAQALTVLVDAGEGYALHDRRVPGRRSNIDHLFVGASGVFVIDAKRYQNADVKVERTGGLFGPTKETLRVGGRRKNDLVEAVIRQCDVVRTALASAGHDDVAVVPVLCFVDAYLPMMKRSRRVGTVHLSGPRKLGEVVAAPGELDDARRFAIAMALSTALPSMT